MMRPTQVSEQRLQQGTNQEFQAAQKIERGTVERSMENDDKNQHQLFNKKKNVRRKKILKDKK